MPDLPEYVEECPMCENGMRSAMFTAGCGQGYFRSRETCTHCDGTTFVWKGTLKPVPISVVNQINNSRAKQ